MDQALLTEEQIVASQDTISRTTGYRREYINDWVNNELLYQEALRRGIPENDQLRRQIETTTKTLVIGALLEQELYSEENVSEDEIVALYNGGGEAFRLREDLVNMSYGLFDDRDAANTFRDKLVRGTAWNDAVAATQSDSLVKSHLLQTAARQYFTQSTLYPTELWKLARNMVKDEVSFAAKTNAGYYVLFTHGQKKQGELPELAYIHGEIRDRILIEKRRLWYEKLLTGLRTTHSVEVRFDDSSSVVNE